MCYCNCPFENRDGECTLGANKIIPSNAKCHPDYNKDMMEIYQSEIISEPIIDPSESDCSEATPPVPFKGIRIISDNQTWNRKDRRICKL